MKPRRNSQVSVSSTFEWVSVPTRCVQTPLSQQGEVHWLPSPAEPGGTSIKVSGWCGCSFLTIPGASSSALVFLLPLVDRRWMNVGKECGLSRDCYPVITSPRFQLASASARPTPTTKVVLQSAEALATPFVHRITHLYSMKARSLTLLLVLFLLSLIYAAVGAVLDLTFLYCVLLLICGLAFLTLTQVSLTNSKLRAAYHDLATALESFAKSPPDSLSKGYALTAYGPFAIQIALPPASHYV